MQKSKPQRGSIRKERNLVGKYVLLSNGSVLKMRDHLRDIESFTGSTVAEIACYLLEFVLHKPSSIETLVNKFERYLEEQYSSLNARIQHCIEILMNFPSDLLRAWFMKNIILRCIGDIDRDVLSSFISNFEDSLCLSKIGKLLDVPSWIHQYVSVHSSVEREPRRAIVSTSNVNSGLILEEPEDSRV